MDESFKARVEKVFGSLASSRSSSLRSSSSSSSSSPLWSISDDEVQRREWRRCEDTSGRDETPCSSSFDDFLKKDRRRRGLEEDLEDDPDRIGQRDEDGAGDDWGIRSSIGLDRTLDYEEEEDEYDKVASGTENTDRERLYMSDVTGRGSFLNSRNVLGNKKDPRSNHLAAKYRLKEDEAEAQKLSPNLVRAAEVKEPADAKGSKNEVRPKPILKRKDNEAVFRSQKRVRFDVEVEKDCKETCPNEAVSKASAGLPDYLVNPSKYTCYSLDSSSEVYEVSDTRACGDFLNEVKNLHDETGLDLENDFATELPKSVTFIPKKKASDAKVVNDGDEVEQSKEAGRRQSLHQEGFPVGIAAGEIEHGTSGVEEDEPETKESAAEADGGGGIGTGTGTGFQKPGRNYRTISDNDDSDT